MLGSIDNPPLAIFSEATYDATWDPSGQYLLFFSERGLYVAQRPDFTPILIAEGLDHQDGYSALVTP